MLPARSTETLTSKGKVEARACDTGAFHIAYNVDDLDGALAAVKAYGVLPVAVDESWIASVLAGMDELPGERKQRLQHRPKCYRSMSKRCRCFLR